MRMLLKAVVDTAAGNAVIADGSVGPVLGELIDRLKPEATYFAGEDGQRACYFVFDMTDAADLPSVCEPLFQATNARVTVTPCMNLEDMQRGLAQVAGARSGHAVPSPAG